MSTTGIIILSISVVILTALLVEDFFLRKEKRALLKEQEEQKVILNEILSEAYKKIGYRFFGCSDGFFSSSDYGICFCIYVISDGDECAIRIEFNEEQIKKILDEGCLSQVHALQKLNYVIDSNKEKKLYKLKELVIGLTTEEIKEGLNIK